jgi:Tfp pilus assembly protein PilN
MIKNYFGAPETSRKIRSAVHGLGRTLKTVLFLSPANEVFIPRREISIAIGMDFLSIAHGSRFFNRIRIKGYKTYRSQEVGRPSPETVAAATSLYCSQANLTNSQVMLSIPKAWAVIQTTELPAAAKENLSDVVAYELDRITPFSPDDAYYDYRLLKAEGGKLQIAIAALRRDTVDPYIKALAEKGLPVTRIDTNLAAVSTYLNYVWQEQDLIYLDIGSSAYESGLIQSGVIVAGCTDSFNGNGPDEHLMADVAENVAPWIERMEKANISPQLVVHSHNGVQYAPLERQLKIPLQVLTNDILAIPELKGEKASDDIPYDAIGGVLSSLWTKSKAMNVLHQGRTTRTSPPLTLTVILMTILLLMGMLVLFFPLYLENERVTAIDREISARKDAVKKIESLRKDFNSLQDEFKAIADFKQGKQNTLQILKEMTVILPKSVWLTRVHINDANVAIEGYATSATDILPGIEASPYFSKVEFSSPTMRDARMNMDRFVIRMELEGIKKEEPKAKNGKKQ